MLEGGEDQVVGADDRDLVRYGDALGLEGVQQQRRVLIVVREDRVQAQARPAPGEGGGGLPGVRELHRGHRRHVPGRDRLGPGEARAGEGAEAAFLGHDHADPAPAPGDEVLGRGGADVRVVEADGVDALDRAGGEGHQGAHSGAAQQLGRLGGEAVAVEGDDGRRAQFGPGPGGVEGVGEAARVQDGRVAVAVELAVQVVDPVADEPADRGDRGGHQDEVAAAGPQGPGCGVRYVTELPGGVEHPRAGALADAVAGGVVQHERHGGA